MNWWAIKKLQADLELAGDENVNLRVQVITEGRWGKLMGECAGEGHQVGTKKEQTETGMEGVGHLWNGAGQ